MGDEVESPMEDCFSVYHRKGHQAFECSTQLNKLRGENQQAQSLSFSYDDNLSNHIDSEFLINNLIALAAGLE